MKRKTLKDIAEELGISLGTVDRAIHNRPDISPITKQRVLDKVAELDYTPDRIGRSLANRSKVVTIGMITPAEPLFYWETLRAGAKASAREMEDFGIRLTFRNIPDKSPADVETRSILAAMDQLEKEGVDGVVIRPRNTPSMEGKIRRLVARNVPVVTINDDLEESGRLFFIGPQTFQSGYLAGSLLSILTPLGGRVLGVFIENVSIDYTQRSEGFLSYFSQHRPDVDVVELRQEATPEARLTIQSIVQKIPSLGRFDGIYNVDGTTFSWMPWLKKRVPVLREARVVGHEVWEQVQEHLIQGSIDFAVHQDPYTQGYFAVQKLINYLLDDIMPPVDKLYTRLDIVSRENCSGGSQILNPHIVTLDEEKQANQIRLP